jgi:hypothetical protein
MAHREGRFLLSVIAFVAITSVAPLQMYAGQALAQQPAPSPAANQPAPQTPAAGNAGSSTLQQPSDNAIATLPAQESPPASLLKPGKQLSMGDQWRLDMEVHVTEYILGLSVLFLIAESALLWRAKAAPDAVMRTLIVTLVVTLGICSLIIGGGDQQQYGPIVGLFGSIIGFLLGQGLSRDGSSVSPDTSPTQGLPRNSSPVNADASPQQGVSQVGRSLDSETTNRTTE